jgi:transcriptional regulator with XRE-family HTH domain
MKRYNKQHIIKELESAIAEAGSLRRFAARADISAAYLSQVRAGTVPPSARLAQALGYDVDGLIYVRCGRPKTK